MGNAINSVHITIKERRTNTETTICGDASAENTGRCVTGMPFVDVVDDSLDSFIFTVKDYPRRKPFKEYDLITYTVKTVEEDGTEVIDETKLFVLFDKVKSYSKQHGGKKYILSCTYEHTVSCVEATKVLEKIKIFNLNLTNRNDTLLRQVEKACLNAEPIFSPIKESRPERFFLTENLENFLKGKPSRDFYFSNTDFRTVLDEMLSAHNARIIVSDVQFNVWRNLNYYYLDYHSMDVVTDVTPIWDEYEQGSIANEELSNNGQDYAGTIVARGYNSVVEEPFEFMDSFKAQTQSLSDTNACIILPFPISDKGIKNLKVSMRVEFFLDGTNGSIINSEDIEVGDIFIPREQFNLLSESEAKGYIPYDIGSSVIEVGQTYSAFFKTVELTFLQTILSRRPDLPSVPYSGVCTSSRFLSTTFIDRSFKICYYPLVDTVSQITKPRVYNREDILLGIMDSQTEQTLYVERHGKKLAGLIKRTGNTEYCLDVKAKYFSKLLPVMSRITLPSTEYVDEESTDEEEKNFVLYKREYAIYDGFVNCRYYFSQNYNAVQENAGVNRERHLFDIPLESSEAPIVTKLYLSFSFAEETLPNKAFNNSLAKSAVKTLIGKNESFTGYTGRIQYLLFQSRGAELSYPQNTENSSGAFPYTEDANVRFMCPICAYAQDKTMTFMARTLDNYSVSYARDGYVFSIWGDQGNKITYNRYVDKELATIGECKRFNLSFAYEYIGSDNAITKFPIVEKTDFILANTEFAVHYEKDRTQKPLFTFLLECLPDEEDYGNIIIGTAFAKYNNLVRDNGTGLTGLYCYPSNKYTFNGDEDVLSKAYIANCPKHLVTRYFTIEETSSGAVLKWNGVKASTTTSGEYDATSWAIADEAGNIYLAVNGDLRDIYVCVKDWP